LNYDLLLATVRDPSAPVDQSHDYDPRSCALVDSHVHTLLADEMLDHVIVTSDADSKTDTRLPGRPGDLSGREPLGAMS
jgi:hypothetical protein